MNTCRICALNTAEEFESIFYDGESISCMMQELCDLQPSEDDGLPDIVCCTCSAELRSAVALKRKCLDSDTKLRQQLNIKLELVPSDDAIHLEDTTDDTAAAPTISFKIIYEESVQPEPTEFYENEHASQEPDCLDVNPEVQSAYQPEQLEQHFLCCGCEMSFATRDLLAEHSQNVHEPTRTENEERPYECGICFRRYMSERGLKFHRRSVYQVKHLQCAICGKRFHNQNILANHERTHSELKPYACDVCPKSFRSRSNLLSHAKLHATVAEQTKHVCAICAKGFSRKSYLKHHYTLLHSEETPFECSFCPSKFKARANLRLHLRTHTQERPYSCDLCEKSFMYPTDKKRHMVQHTGQKPFKCADCDKAFTRKTLLRKHRLCHEADVI